MLSPYQHQQTILTQCDAFLLRLRSVNTCYQVKNEYANITSSLRVHRQSRQSGASRSLDRNSPLLIRKSEQSHHHGLSHSPKDVMSINSKRIVINHSNTAQQLTDILEPRFDIPNQKVYPQEIFASPTSNNRQSHSINYQTSSRILNSDRSKLIEENNSNRVIDPENDRGDVYLNRSSGRRRGRPSTSSEIKQTARNSNKMEELLDKQEKFNWSDAEIILLTDVINATSFSMNSAKHVFQEITRHYNVLSKQKFVTRSTEEIIAKVSRDAQVILQREKQKQDTVYRSMFNSHHGQSSIGL